jgi:hypothetical protein
MQYRSFSFYTETFSKEVLPHETFTQRSYAHRRFFTKEKLHTGTLTFFRPTPDGSRQVVYQAGKTIALCKFTELMQWQRCS